MDFSEAVKQLMAGKRINPEGTAHTLGEPYTLYFDGRTVYIDMGAGVPMGIDQSLSDYLVAKWKVVP